MLVALSAVPLVVALRPVGDPVFDPDIWWHLRAGQWVVEHGAVPQLDPFSQPGQGKAWVAYSWLYEVLVFGLYHWLGLAGVVAYRVALSLAVVAALHRLVARREGRFLVATALTAAATLAVAMLFSERPWLFTVLFTTLTLDVILDLRAGRRTPPLWLLPALYALWANIHIQFVYGLLLLALAAFAPLLDRALGRTDPEATRAGWRLPALAVACLLATLLTPYHVHLYGVVLEYATQPGPFRFVNELKAMEFREPCDWVVLALAGAATFALGRRPHVAAFDALLLAAAAFLSFRARRDLWFVVLAALSILTAASPRTIPAEAHFTLTPRRWAVLAVGLALLAAVTAWARGLSPANLEARVAAVFPVRAAQVVAEHHYPGPLFNDFNWGGYLIWALPDLPVSLDGRTNLHGDERLLRHGNTWSGGPGWHDDPDLSAAGVVIAPADTPLATLLQTDDRFRLAHEDPLAKVFVARRAR
jgi:hypothetical protein